MPYRYQVALDDLTTSAHRLAASVREVNAAAGECHLDNANELAAAALKQLHGIFASMIRDVPFALELFVLPSRVS